MPSELAILTGERFRRHYARASGRGHVVGTDQHRIVVCTCGSKVRGDGAHSRLGVPRTRIERVVKGETAMTADTALRLSAFFRNTPEFWLNLQRAYDLARARAVVDVSHIGPLAAA